MTDYQVERTALIDADVIAYTCAAWAHGSMADQLELTERVEAMLDDWTRRAFCTKRLICFSCPREDNFRKDAYPLYKSHRTVDPPAMLPLAREVSAEAGPVVRRNRIEADDILGILATNDSVDNPVMVTVDKDLRQIPGWHFNPNKEDFPVRTTEVEADWVFYQQWLTGDSTDGFGGIKGIGPAKATKILNGGEDWLMEVLRAYRDAGYTADQAIAQARCARILRAGDWDSEKQAPIPWTPPQDAVDAVWEDGRDG